LITNFDQSAFPLKAAKEVEEIILKWFVPNDIARKAVTDSFQISADCVEKKCRPCIKCCYRYRCGHQFREETFYKRWLELFEKSVHQKVEVVHLHCLFKRR